MLDAIKQNGIKRVINYPQKLVNIEVSKALKESVPSDKSLKEYIDKLKSVYCDYRIIVRPSGTENKIRVMVEGVCEIKVNEIVSKVCDFITQKYL
jgi:phosphoglucosamine mutase